MLRGSVLAAGPGFLSGGRVSGVRWLTGIRWRRGGLSCRAEVDKQVVEGATVAEQFIRDGIRMITRG